MKTFGSSEPFADDGHQHVNGHGDPYLGLDGVGRLPEEALDAQVLFDPFEKYFHCPASLVEPGDHQSRQLEVIGEIDKEAAALLVPVTDPAQEIGIVALAVKSVQVQQVVGPHAGGVVDGQGAHAVGSQVVLGADDKEGAGAMQGVEVGEVQIGAVHDVEGPGLHQQFGQGMDIVLAPLGDGQESGDGSPQVQQGVEFDGGLGGAEAGPGKEVEAQIDGGGIQHIRRGGQLGVQRIVLIEAPGLADERLGQGRVELPVASLVGLGQRAAADGGAEAQMIEQVVAGHQAIDGVAQAGAESQLGKGHAEELIPAGKLQSPGVGNMSMDQAIEMLRVNLIEELGEDGASLVHGPRVVRRAKMRKNRPEPPNRSHLLVAVDPYS